ncbi:MAG TPA: TipAS antibiotic-recognition domain-containing protein [Candidatus Aminicenantes bacterium]|nr:TipAS antibiotic-recognition domain-containing protein [Candidatus Aminicenantes bacterium]
MSGQNNREWTKKFFTEADLKEFEGIGKSYSPQAMKACQDKWAALIGEIRANLNADPAGLVARDLARRWQALFNEAYGGHPGLGRKIDRAYRRARKTGDDFGGQMPFEPEILDFIKKALKTAGIPCGPSSR